MRKVVLILVLACAVAHADDKSRETAAYLSGGGAAVSGAVLLTSFLTAGNGEPFNNPVLYTGLAIGVVAPSLGQFYAGEWFTPGMAVRIASAGLAVYAVRNEEAIVTCDDANTYGQMCKQLKGAGVALIGVAAIGYIGGMWYDSLDAADAADRWNKRHHVIVTPTPNGVAVAGTF